MKKLARNFSVLGIASVLTLLWSPAPLVAGSATWNLNPTSSNWNTATNWNPATVPNGLSDVATFAISNVTDVSLASSVTLNGIVFQPGASQFTITSPSALATFLINGTGLTNNSGVEQTFVTAAQGRDQGGITFAGSATAGDATYVNNGAAVRNSFGGNTSFFNTSTANSATFVADGGHVNGADGGGVLFFDSSTAGSASFTINGGTASGATGGHVEFVNTSNADHATLVANGGTNGGDGGTIFFLDDSLGGRANVTLSGNATLDLSSHNAPGVIIGALQGSGGLVALGSSSLTVNNKPDIIFGGVISGRGSLMKGAQGSLDLTNANTYAGGTNIRDGTLLIDNPTGSGTGSGPVRVKSGALGGTGSVAGSVTVGANIPGNGAFLVPGASFGHPGTFTILGSLTFNSDGFFNCGFRETTIGQVIANGVAINSEAQFAFFNNRGTVFPGGTVIIVINNTAATPIAGQFENLPDGFIFTSGGNSFQVNYEGGDGNDLTLTAL
jgi:autotransporter-associated beta strand protein